VAAATRDATPRQWAGATVRNIATDAEMSAYGTPGVTGVLVVTAPPNAHSPLRAGDVIVSVDGKATDAVTDLPAAAGRRVRVLRQQREVDLPVQGA
jgi:S1-C subfamily serine protease